MHYFAVKHLKRRCCESLPHEMRANDEEQAEVAPRARKCLSCCPSTSTIGGHAPVRKCYSLNYRHRKHSSADDVLVRFSPVGRRVNDGAY